MSDLLEKRVRDRMPVLGDVALYWMGLEDQGELGAVFSSKGYFGDFGEPFCFRCGWQAPVRPGKTIRGTWTRASGWLERCHLHDHCEGGGEGVSNIVPMCPWCHRLQPICRSRDEGIAYVGEDVVYPPEAMMGVLPTPPLLDKSEFFFRQMATVYQELYLRSLPGDGAYWPLSERQHRERDTWRRNRRRPFRVPAKAPVVPPRRVR